MLANPLQNLIILGHPATLGSIAVDRLAVDSNLKDATVPFYQISPYTQTLFY